MAALPTISETIQIGDISIYKSANDNAKGNLFSPRLANPTSPVTIAIVTDALRWQYEGDSTDSTLRATANYLIWLCGRYALEARQVLGMTTGGGSVVPGGGESGFGYPLRLTGADFEPDGITFNNPNIVGDNLMMFVSNFNEEWQFAPTFFQYTPTGIVVVFPGFDANNYDQIILDQYFNV